jgi:hypothetical protein
MFTETFFFIALLHSGSLSEVRPLNKYKWQGEWTVRVDNTTDNAGLVSIADVASSLLPSRVFTVNILFRTPQIPVCRELEHVVQQIQTRHQHQ